MVFYENGLLDHGVEVVVADHYSFWETGGSGGVVYCCDCGSAF